MKHLKEEFDKLTFKEVLTYTLAIFTALAGLTLLYLNMYMPPEGQIHESVLTAFSIILIFVGTLLGISMHYANELNKFKGTVNDMIQQVAERMTAPGTSDNSDDNENQAENDNHNSR